MPSSNESSSKYCGGNVKPARFVTLDSVQGRVVQALANGVPYGISDKSTWQVPLSPPGGGANVLDDGLAGKVGSPPITIWHSGSEVYLCSGAAFAIGDKLKADADGCGILAAAGNNVGAIALEAAGAAGEYKKVRVVHPTLA